VAQIKLACFFFDSYIASPLRSAESMNGQSQTTTESTLVTAQVRVSEKLDRAAELQHAGKLTEAAGELDTALSIARATPYEIEFLMRIRLAMTLSDTYLLLDRIEDARALLADETIFAEKITQIMQATGNPSQKRAAMSGYLQVRDRATQVALIGQAAPEISVKQWINGGPVTLADARGRVVLLEFWATWCKPCHEMFPGLNQLYEKQRARGLEIIALTRHYLAYRGTAESLSDELELMRKMVTEHAVSFPVGVAEDEHLQTIYGANGLPTVVLIDRQGIMRYAGPGGDEPMFVRALEDYLKAPA